MATHPTSRPDAPKPLGVRANAEQRRILQEAAKREHRSVSSFVLRAALNAAAEREPADTEPSPRRRTSEEIDALLAPLRAKIAAANPGNRDLVAELIAERRAEAALEEES